MKWLPSGDKQWFREDGRARVMLCAGDLPYFAMWYRERPNIGQWLPVLAPGGRVTYRRSLPAAYEAVAEAVEMTDRVEAA